MTKNAQFIADYLGCECEAFAATPRCEAAVRRYHELAAEGEAGGFTPLVILPTDTLVEMLEEINAGDRAAVLAEAGGIDGRKFLEGRLAADEFLELIELGEFTAAEPDGAFEYIAADVSGAEEALAAKIPTRNPWEPAAWVPMGGWNECPAPAEQVAVFKRWHEAYGAVPCAVSHDVWQMAAANPPRTDEGAERLAWELFAFDPEMAGFDGAETIRRLAGCMKGAKTWAFWWD